MKMISIFTCCKLFKRVGSEEVQDDGLAAAHSWDDDRAQEELALTAIENTILGDVTDNGDTQTQVNFEIASEGSMARSHDKGADIIPGESLAFSVNMESIEPITVEK